MAVKRKLLRLGSALKQLSPSPIAPLAEDGGAERIAAPTPSTQVAREDFSDKLWKVGDDERNRLTL
jgi:hypothetical protein